ncbi:MAG: class I SAM-dependent methyltransferase [Gammaproteobacteria bacterium]|nr:class I SAM-dependent methyltransferase [Gammaproteobacteria bacterium]
MAEVDLLRALPKAKRDINARASARTEEHIRISREYGELYFDGPREYGYGGYRYDGRWQPVAKDIVAHFDLKPGDRVLDVGAAKGFLVKDLLTEGMDAYGLDISEYALMHCHSDVIGRLHLGNAQKLPFPNNSFKCVICIDTIHNLPRERAKNALQEIQRVSGGQAFVRVDSYRTPEQKTVFENWVLTAEFHDYPDGWIKLFKEAGYTSDWYWTIIE